MKPEEKSNYLYKVIPHQACQFTCYKAIEPIQVLVNLIMMLGVSFVF